MSDFNLSCIILTLFTYFNNFLIFYLFGSDSLKIILEKYIPDKASRKDK